MLNPTKFGPFDSSSFFPDEKHSSPMNVVVGTVGPEAFLSSFDDD